MTLNIKGKDYKVEKRIQPDGSAILVLMGRVKNSKYKRHQGGKERGRRRHVTGYQDGV